LKKRGGNFAALSGLEKKTQKKRRDAHEHISEKEQKTTIWLVLVVETAAKPRREGKKKSQPKRNLQRDDRPGNQPGETPS